MDSTGGIRRLYFLYVYNEFEILLCFISLLTYTQVVIWASAIFLNCHI